MLKLISLYCQLSKKLLKNNTMQTTINSNVLNFWNGFKRAMYAVQVLTLIIGIPLLAYLQMVHGETKVDKAGSVKKETTMVPAQQPDKTYNL